ncbi:MAG TPA: AAA family ATPase [Polyangiaceae bacterium]|jgi:hypothetical protein
MGDLKDDLALASAYGPHAASEVQLVETHISWVFLVGDDVYKVKKPVDLGFLDFHTTEARKAACHAEVTLNARLAPGVYLGVVPIRRGPDGVHRIEGPGDTVDWAVHMARLPDGARADGRVVCNLLRGEDVDAIARRLAEFHAGARCDAETSRFGEPDVIARNVFENFTQTRGDVERFVRPAEAEEIERTQTDFLRDKASLFRARADGGRVRDGHGDLRLEHVYLEGGRVTIVDCIEFNDRFRYGDVCSDVAFLSMDLAWHGRVDLAERLLARYAREADDFDLYALVDFYEGYRAYVRAKVSMLLAADAGAGDRGRDRARVEARRYLLLALAAGRRSLLSPRLVCVGGLVASGKSTIAEAISHELGAPVIDADRTRKRMLGVTPTSHVDDGPWQGAYEPRVTSRVYAEVLRRARVVLASGRPVIVDASFRSRAMRDSARHLAAELGVPFAFVECRCPPDVARRRLTARDAGGVVSDARLPLFDEFAARFEPFDELSDRERIVLDTSSPLEDGLSTLRARVATWPRGLVM